MTTLGDAALIYQMACHADSAVRGHMGALRRIESATDSLHPECMATKYLELSESLLREVADAIAAKREALTKPKQVAA